MERFMSDSNLELEKLKMEIDNKYLDKVLIRAYCSS